MHAIKRRVAKYTSRLWTRHQGRSSKVPSRPSRENADESGGPSTQAGLQDYESQPPSDRNGYLAVELILRIFKYLPPLEVLRCRAVCKRFQQIIDETPSVQYKIELCVAGLKDNEENTSMGVTDRLQSLMAHQRWAKSTQAYTWEAYTRGINTTQPVYQYYDNARLTFRYDSGSVEEDADGWKPGSNVIAVISLEETADGQPIEDSWEFKLPFVFTNCVADLSKGVAYLGHFEREQFQQFSMRTISIHDGAVLSEHIFQVDVEPGTTHREFSQRMHCMDNIVACFIYTGVAVDDDRRDDMDLILIDIERGEIIARRAMDNVLAAGMTWDLQFLSTDTFIIHVVKNWRLVTEVYEIRSSATTGLREIEHVATFEYPSVAHGRIDYYPTQVCPQYPHSGRITRKVPPPPFLQARTSYLITIHRRVGEMDVVHCVPSSVFISRTKWSQVDTCSRGMPSIIPWDSWGPDNSRCFLDAAMSIIPTSAGHRTLLHNFTLLDFTPLDVARDLHRLEVRAQSRKPSSNSLSSWIARSFALPRLEKRVKVPTEANCEWVVGTGVRLVNRPTVIQNLKGNSYADHVITRLPYRETKLLLGLDERRRSCLHGEIFTTLTNFPDVDSDTWHYMRRT